MSEQAQQEQLNEISRMPRGWDSYDALPINKRAILEARRIVSWMPDYWTIVPRSDGALQLERHAGGLDIECVITGTGSAQETRSVDMSGQPMGDPHPAELTRNGQCPVCGWPAGNCNAGCPAGNREAE